MGLLSLCDGPGWGTALGSFLFSSPCVCFLLCLLQHGTCSDDFFLSAFFSVLCLTASSPKSFPPPGSSSLSCLGPDSSSPRSPWPALASGPHNRKRVTLLPPFLSDQAQRVHALGAFYLFCQATGESRASVSMAVPLLCPYCSLLFLSSLRLNHLCFQPC